MPPASAKPIHGLLFSLLGILLFGIAGISVYLQMTFVRTAQQAEGVIVSLNAGKAHPNVSFSPEPGISLRSSENGWISYDVGDHVTVLYTPGDAQRSARINDPGALWFAASCFCGLGAMCLLLGLLALTRFREYLAFNSGKEESDTQERMDICDSQRRGNWCGPREC